MSASYLEALNPRQQEAVLHEDGGALVLAGAGTGKTRVLTGRIIHLLREQKARPPEILAVTFTNKAAQEMRARVQAALPAAPKGLMLGTFHAICHRILRTHAAAAGLDKDFQILDSSDQTTFIRRLLRERGISEDEYPINEVRNFISASKERGWRPAAVPAQSERARQLIDIYAKYEAACKRDNRVDFAELMLAVMELWRGNDELRQRYARRFRHILIDEFQDTSRQQFDWLRMLDSGDNAFFAVGDDDQSIYAFRGAEPAIMQEFQSRLRAQKLIRLEENYRSVKNILDAANHLISGNSDRLGKTLTTAAGEGAAIDILQSDNDGMEAMLVAQLLRDYIDKGGSKGVGASDAAVLYRTNAQGRLFERELMNYGVPYRVYGGLRFYDRAEVKHALAYLRLMATDDTDALVRVINMPPRGIGEKTVAGLMSDGNPFAALGAVKNRRVNEFGALLQDLRAVRGTLAERTRAALEQSGLLAHFESKRETERVENLRELVNAAAEFEEKTELEDADPLMAFLATAALDSGGEGVEGDGQAVSLMTVHAAKGLEFKRVFVAGLEEGLFPHSQSIGEERAVEEERRLLYVAITRAREELSLHFAVQRMQYGKTVFNLPSRFLRELPERCLADDDWRKVSDTTLANEGVVGWRRAQAPHGEDAPRHTRAMAMMAPPPPKIRSRGEGFRIGDAVRHSKYGTGVVMNRQGSGADEQISVFFKKAGNKLFKTALAKLERV